MYVRLCTSDTLHKKPCRIGSGLCGTSENAHKAKIVELPKAEFRNAEHTSLEKSLCVAGYLHNIGAEPSIAALLLP
jgi:hypothetical protein